MTKGTLKIYIHTYSHNYLYILKIRNTVTVQNILYIGILKRGGKQKDIVHIVFMNSVVIACIFISKC